ncbi:MAG TPA: YidC/Oxa1 family membrane protein insertase [Actinomycetota bacterium]|nr:YidC/Oxa1 family membrane protein insertase [Actinomycetota bacterium]
MDFGFFELFSSALAGFYALIPSYGLAIILLTVAVRVLLLPLSIKQTRSMREMQRIQPEIKRLQAKYKGNRQKMNEELMALYKEHNVNPFGGCLPLLMQFPVLIGLFYVVREPLKYMAYLPIPRRGTPIVGWEPAPDVTGLLEKVQGSALAEGLQSAPEKLNQFLGMRLDCSAGGIISPPDPDQVRHALEATCPQGIVASWPYLLLVVLMGVTTWYQQKQMQASRGPGAANDPTAKQMQMMGKIMPVMLMFFAYTFPLGVVLYWLTTNVWTIGQQRIILAAAPPEPPKGAEKKPKQPVEAKVGKTSGNGSGGKTKPHPSSKKKRRR